MKTFLQTRGQRGPVAVGSSGAAPSKQDIKDAAKKTADKATELKDKAADAVASGTEKAKEEVSKRTTRSSDKSS